MPLVILQPVIFVIGLFANGPIKSLRFVISSMGMMAAGRMKLKITWLKTNIFIGLSPSKMISIPGNIVINLVALSLIFKPKKPCIIVWPAIVPTAEDDRPEAMSAKPKALLDAAPNKGDKL